MKPLRKRINHYETIWTVTACKQYATERTSCAAGRQMRFVVLLQAKAS